MKPCPFCGRRDYSITLTRKGTRIPFIGAAVHCFICGIDGPRAWREVTSEDTARQVEEDARRLWNERKQGDEGAVICDDH